MSMRSVIELEEVYSHNQGNSNDTKAENKKVAAGSDFSEQVQLISAELLFL
ncbi:hypothetical protein TUM17387_11680 [Shewanella carassii]|uniref:Uncharacterized protein n=1 Tax=Shewanella carassii TaxID=1987584 RepID=A0ABQ1T347_9GAMM|nr:hypothetical protein TUM17387_11680 [Shewanella carassii]GGE75225.1 hypothetical protein GCM10011520_14780 [Shewanella carassii]